MAKIIGIATTSFTPKDSTTPIEGTTVYTTEAIDPKSGTGSKGDKFFLTRAKLSALDFTPAVGQDVEVLYNKFGKVATLRLLTDLEVDFD